MEKEFIPYEQALTLKELGFDNENCLGWWTYRYDSTEGYLDTLKNYCFQIKDDLNRQCLAPLYQQAFRWFREKYNIDVNIQKDSIGIYHFNIDTNKYGDWREPIFNKSYEEAELECLKKLIEIVKKQKEYESNIIV